MNRLNSAVYKFTLKKLNFFPNSIPSLTNSYDVYAYVLQRTSNWDQPPAPPPPTPQTTLQSFDFQHYITWEWGEERLPGFFSKN